MSDVLNKCTVKLDWQNAKNGKSGTSLIDCELLESDAFKYGNGTCVIMTWRNNETMSRYIDTRYTRAVIDDFEAFCMAELARYYGSNRKVIDIVRE